MDKSSFQKRERWQSRYSFLLACIGSAVGLGNIWRFPWLSFTYGGGFFFIPYIIALIIIGLPMLFLELGMGRTTQRGDVEAFGSIHPRLKGIGIASVFGGFMITTYYTNIIAWSCVYFIASFKSPLPWKGQEYNFFFNDVLRLGSTDQLDDVKSYSISSVVYAGLIFIWMFCFMTLAYGVKGVGRVVKLTVPLPLIIIVILLIYNATLDGARDGIDAYIGKWDASIVQKEAGIWSSAVGQIFFSNSVALGVMTAYGSYNDESSNIVMDNVIISLTNSMTSFIAGLAVYAVLGNVAYLTNMPIEAIGDTYGVGLTFVIYPSAISNFDTNTGHFMGAIFFLSIFTLGIDSALSLIEGFVTVLKDTKRFEHVKRSTITGYVCASGFLISTLYASDIGVYLLESIDHYINIYGVLLIGGVEAYSVGWIGGYKKASERVGILSANLYTFGFLCSMIIGIILGASLYNSMSEEKYLAVAFPIAFSIFIIFFFTSFALRNNVKMSFYQWLDAIVFTGTENLRIPINEAAEKYGCWKLPKLWDIIVKYIVPPALFTLIVSAAINDANDDESDLSQYPNWVHSIGIIVLCIMLSFLIGFAFYPEFWDPNKSHIKNPDLVIESHTSKLDHVNETGQLKESSNPSSSHINI